MVLDNKADTLEMQQILDQKADAKAVEDNCVDRNKVEELERRLNTLSDQLQFKCEQARVEELTEDYQT